MNNPGRGWIGRVGLGITHVPVRDIDELRLSVAIYVCRAGSLRSASVGRILYCFHRLDSFPGFT